MGNQASTLNPKTDLYDIIIDINRICDVKEDKNARNARGWGIQLHPQLAEEVRKASTEKEAMNKLRMDEKKTVVAVMGLFNRGKTFLLNKLAARNLPSDKKLHTKGLSFLDIPEHNLIVVDTAGTNAPLGKLEVMYFEKEIEALAQKRSTEMFLQELTFDLADLIIVVVNELTWPDQEYLKTLRQKLEDSSKQYKQLLVVHNFSDTKTEEDLLNMWRKYIVSNHTGNIITAKTDKGSAVYFQEENHGNQVTTLHFFMASEGSPAGKAWNSKTIQLLVNNMINRQVHQKGHLADLLQVKISQSLALYCKKPIKVRIEWNGNQGQQQIVETKKSFLRPLKRIGENNDEIDFSEWTTDNTTESLEDMLDFANAYTPEFKVVCDGDVSLKNDCVNFDGFRILLTRRNEEFSPRYDVLRLQNSFQVLFDVPGIESGANDQWAKWGGISVEVEHVEDNNVKSSFLVVKGFRKLFYVNFVTAIEFREYSTNQSDDSNNKWKRRDNKDVNSRRQFSEQFEVKVPIPQDIQDNLEGVSPVVINGLYIIDLPEKKQIQNVKSTSTLEPRKA